MTLVYPTNSEYVAALKSAPQKRFTNELLKRLEFEKKGIGLAVMTGGLAIVFKAQDPSTSKRYALRCFKGHSAERQQRYSEISKFLNARKSQLPFVVDFEFFAEEIRVKSAEGLPVVLMQWVDGNLLKQWIQARCDDKNKKQVLALADKWRRMIARMRSLNFAHGDLQHGNILVNDKDEFILIDYDGMAVPNLHGPDSPELGLPGYQHRERTLGKSNRLSADLDNFSAINIFVCLHAIAVNPEVFSRFGDHDEGLLFHPHDIESPDRSEKFDYLQALGDQQLAKWVSKLRALAMGPLSNVPSLEQFLCDPQQIIKALDAADWEKAIELADEGEAADLPAELMSRLDQARSAVECLRLLKLAVDSGDERRIAGAWIESVFRNYPAAKQLSEYGSKAKQIVPVLDQLTEHLKKQDGRAVVITWDKHQALLNGRTSAQGYAAQVEDWRKRNRLADQVKQLLKSAGKVLLPDLVALADQLQKLGGHPELNNSADFLSTVHRNRLAQKLLTLSYAETAENDKKWFESWDQRSLSGFPPIASLELHFQEARDRRAAYDNLASSIIATSANSLVEENQIAELATFLPADYCPSLSSRSVVALQRIKAVTKAAKACQTTGPIREASLVAALEGVRRVAAESLLQAADRDRMRLAEQRVPVLEQLALVPQESSLDSDSRILALWRNEQLLKDCDDAIPFRGRYQVASERSRLLTQLQQAKDVGDDLKVRDIAAHVLLQGFKFDQSLQNAVKQATEAAASADVLLRQLESDKEEEFARNLDVESLSRFWPLFRQHQAKIRKWMLNGALKPSYIGLSTPALGQAMHRSGPTIRIKWHFPSRVTETCIVTFSRGQTESAADLQTPRILFRQEVSFKTFEQGGSACTLPVGRFEGASVCIWAIVEVSGEHFYSAPLNLGRIPSN